VIRLLLRLFGIKDFEVCKSCETLKQQLDFERFEKKQLTETLLSIIKPKVYEAPPQELVPVVNTSGLFSRKRAALEARDREEARILSQGQNLGRPNESLKDIEKLEQELDVSEIEGRES